MRNTCVTPGKVLHLVLMVSQSSYKATHIEHATVTGPAKVYVLYQQKYKRFFLRVSANLEVETSAINLEVESDKSIHVYVESVSGSPVSKS
jgi:hypothetical protein